MVLLRRHFRVMGIVQGVGFRPFVARLAVELGLGGLVRNTTSAVGIEVEGDSEAIVAFGRRLEAEIPRAATIEHLEWEDAPPTGSSSFVIAPSEVSESFSVGLPADLAVCQECLGEMRDPSDRRFRYPFLNCTLCGPRYSIVDGLPYDRPLTSMRDFPMCSACRLEYEDPSNRRYHAQPIACPKCGPQLQFATRTGVRSRGTEALQDAIEALQQGSIVAIRGIGGFHLACDARNPEAVSRLRERKARGDQPFALMVRDALTAQSLVAFDEQEQRLLESVAAPIVLLRKREGHPLGDSLAPGNGYLGVMLPYSPLHHLLFEALDALVMTSGNRHGEPIATGNQEAIDSLATLADAFLLHDREILAACDDSVVRLSRGRMLAIRRGRGYAPLSMRLPVEAPPSLAVGAELKSAPAIGSGRRLYLSPHVGDMENLSTIESFEKTVRHLSALYRIEVERVIHDAHPGYLSTEWAKASGLPAIAVQHHRAHVASVLAEYAVPPEESVVAAVFDGTGYGDDGAIWGGEFFQGPVSRLDRVAHLPYLSLPGGDGSARRPTLVAVSCLRAAGLDWVNSEAGRSMTEEEQRVVGRQLERGLNCHASSSMGRLFDAAASMLGIRHRVRYEAQAAIELEAIAARWVHDESYSAARWQMDVLWGELLADQGPLEARARRFHGTIARWTCEEIARIAEGRRVVLCGGVFQNVLLLGEVSHALEQLGLKVLSPRYLPPNDGGLALGQMYLGAVADFQSEK